MLNNNFRYTKAKVLNKINKIYNNKFKIKFNNKWMK